MATLLLTRASLRRKNQSQKGKTTMYMSYCRIEGTYQELKAVLNDVQDHINGEAEIPVSERERRFFTEMVNLFYDFMADNFLIDENGELDSRELENVLVQMEHGADEDEEGGF